MKNKYIFVITLIIILFITSGCLTFVDPNELEKDNKTSQLLADGEKAYKEGDYLTAHHLFACIPDRNKTDESALKIIESYLNGKYKKDDISNLSFERIKTDIYDVVIKYLQDCVTPNKEEAESAVFVLSKCGYNEQNNLIYKSLSKVPDVYSSYYREPLKYISYEDYISEKYVDDLFNHYLYTSDLKNRGVCTSDEDCYDGIESNVGLCLYFTYNDINEGTIERDCYYIIYGDYSNCYIFAGTDGNWFYGLKDNSILFRVDVNGTKEIIDVINPTLINKIEFGSGYSDIFGFEAELENGLVCSFRYFLNEGIKETFTYDIDKKFLVSVIDRDGKSTVYKTYSNEFIDYYNKVATDDDYFYEILCHYRNKEISEYMAYKTKSNENFNGYYKINSSFEDTDYYKYYVEYLNLPLYTTREYKYIKDSDYIKR